ncbi:hypothetical protein B5M09_013724, partial [Aphanomyces astaci]
GREDTTKNNGIVGGKAETIVPKNAEPSARKGCLMCGDMSHRVARCPKTALGEAETLLAAQVKLWKDGIKVLVNQPQRQKTESGVQLLENVVRVDDVLLDSGSDVTVVTRGVMDALDAASVKVGTVSHSVPHLAYPYGSDANTHLIDLMLARRRRTKSEIPAVGWDRLAESLHLQLQASLKSNEVQADRLNMSCISTSSTELDNTPDDPTVTINKSCVNDVTPLEQPLSFKFINPNVYKGDLRVTHSHRNLTELKRCPVNA